MYRIYDNLHYATSRVILYNGGAALDLNTAPGGGTTGNITLPIDASKLSEITIYYRYGAANGSMSKTFPNDSVFGIYMMFVAQEYNIWIKTRAAYVNGTTITNYTRSANIAWALSSGSCVYAVSYDTPEILINRVEGKLL